MPLCSTAICLGQSRRITATAHAQWRRLSRSMTARTRSPSRTGISFSGAGCKIQFSFLFNLLFINNSNILVLNRSNASATKEKNRRLTCIKINLRLWWNRCVSIRTFSISTSGAPEKPLAFWGEGRAREWTDVFAIRQKRSQTHFALTWH